jgi:hypothetical protein
MDICRASELTANRVAGNRTPVGKREAGAFGASR